MWMNDGEDQEVDTESASVRIAPYSRSISDFGRH
jgi:hypothetical protein